jgi:hypothetical protein
MFRRSNRFLNLGLICCAISLFLWDYTHHLQQQRRDNFVRHNFEVLNRCCREPDLKHNVIHLPKNGCPGDWTLVKDLFVWQDGTRIPGCVDETDLRQSGAVRIDVLLAGEAVQLVMRIRPRPPVKPEVPSLSTVPHI